MGRAVLVTRRYPRRSASNYVVTVNNDSRRSVLTGVQKHCRATVRGFLPTRPVDMDARYILLSTRPVLTGGQNTRVYNRVYVP